MSATRTFLLILFLVAMGVAALYAYSQRPMPAQQISISDLIEEVRQGKVKSIDVPVGGGTAMIELRNGTKQQATIPEQSAEGLRKDVDANNLARPESERIRFQFKQESQPYQWLGQLLIALLPIVLIAGLFLYMLRQASVRVPAWGLLRSRGMKAVVTERAPKAIGPYAQAIAAGDLIFCSGQVALDPKSGDLVDGTIREQTRAALDNLAAVLRAAGSDLRHVVKTTVYLTDLTDFNEMNAVYGEAFAGHTPARATVEVRGLPRGARVEIECVAIPAS